MRNVRKITVFALALCLLSPALAQDPVTTAASDIDQLKAQIRSQQEQIEQLRTLLLSQQKMLERLAAATPSAINNSAANNTGSQAAAAGLAKNTGGRATAPDRLIASTTPMVVPPSMSPTPARVEPQAQAATATSTSAPLQLKIGDTTIMPVGFMDLTSSWKDKNAGGSLGTNFGSIPYNNVPQAKLSEFRFSPQNSRIGFRVDGNWKGAHFIGYNEFDFLGTSGAFNISVDNGAFVPRLRLFWVDVRKDKWEVLAGQSWSFLTPNRKGLGALPADLFYSQVIDVNYIIGLPWTRQPGARVIYHPSDKVAMGVSFENPDQYIGGSGGGPIVTLPAALTGLAGLQLDNSSNVQTIPNVHPDIIAKVAYDPSAKAHIEIAGIERTFKVWNITTGQPTSARYFNKVAGGGAINANFEVAKNVRLFTNNLWGAGVGRFFFGNAPDLIIRSNADISPIHSGGMVQGVEATHNKWLFYAYYGAVYIDRNVAIDLNGNPVGYGYRGAPNSQNRTIQEGTFGFNQTIWRDPRYGAINFMGQYAYFFRNPWYVAPNTPKATHLNTLFFNLRYTLPGAPPPAR